MTYLKPNQRQIIKALEALGGEATLGEIAQESGLTVNGLSQSIGARPVQQFVEYIEGQTVSRARDTKYRLARVATEQLSLTSPVPPVGDAQETLF